MAFLGRSKDVEAYERDCILVFGNASIGASGAVVASSLKGGGMVSLVKESTAGQYTLEIRKPNARLLSAEASVMHASISGVAAVQVLENPANVQADFKADGKLVFQCIDYAGAAVNPPSGSSIRFELKVRHTSSGPFD